MATVDVSSSYCQSCGSVAAGRFCSHCGAEFKVSGSKGAVGHLVDELLNDKSAGYFGALLTILKSPVHGTLKLVHDAHYRAHKSFFFTNSAIVLAVASTVYKPTPTDPNEAVWLRHLSEALGHYSALVLTVTQYVGVFGGFLIGYWIFRRFSRAPRTAGDFFKLTCLTAGFTALLNAVRQIPELGMLLFGANVFGGPKSPLHLGLGILVFLCTCYIFYYSVRCQKLFWELSLVRVLICSALVLLVMMSIILAQFFLIAGIAALIYE